jgi:hypothetical protein
MLVAGYLRCYNHHIENGGDMMDKYHGDIDDMIFGLETDTASEK